MRRTRYEEVPIECCDTCHGYLITTRQLDGIKRRRDKTKSELEQEAATRALTNSERKLRCPNCYKRMHHRTWEGVARLEVDLCPACMLIWLNPGELARAQLNYEETPQAKEALKFKTRHTHMTPEERQEFEENIARLPTGNLIDGIFKPKSRRVSMLQLFLHAVDSAFLQPYDK